MASSSKGLGPRFHDYLNGLREEFELQSDPTLTKSLRERRFNIYLGGLCCEFELMAEEIESLRRERDKYKAKVEAQAKEPQDVRRNFFCQRCSSRIMTAPQLPASPKIALSSTASIFISQSQYLDKPNTSNASRGVNLTQEMTARRSTQSTFLSQKLPSTTARYTIAAHSRAGTRPPSPLRVPAWTADPHSGSKGAWSITFNDEVKKELDVKIAHELFHGKAIMYVKFSQDGKYLAAGCLDGKAYIYDVETGTLIRVLKNLLAEYEIITAVCFSGDTKYLATGLGDGGIYIWEINMKYVRNALKGHTKTINSFCFSPNSRLLVSTSHDSTVRVWNLRDGATNLLIEDRPTFTDSPYYSSAVFSPDGKCVAASHCDGVVRIWDVGTGRLMRRTKADMGCVEDVAFMPDGSGLLSGGDTLKYWDVCNLEATRFSQTTNDFLEGVEEWRRPEREFFGHQDIVRCLAVSPDGRWVVSCSDDKSVRIWDTQNAAMQCILKHDHRVWTVDVSPAGCSLASGGRVDNMVRIWKCSYVTPRVRRVSGETEEQEDP